MTIELERLRELIAIDRAIASTQDYDELLRRVVEKTATFTRADVCALLLAGADGTATFAASVGLDPDKTRGFSVPFDERVSAELQAFCGFKPDDEFLGKPLIDQNGEITGVLAVCRRAPEHGTSCMSQETSCMSQEEEEFLLSALADQAAITLRTALTAATLRRRANELLEADRLKDEFLSMLAHELRNPLAAILSAVQLIGLRRVSDPVVQRAEAVAVRQCLHMTRLLDDLLDVSRISRGKVELRKQAVRLADAIDHAVQTAGPLIEARGHRLSVSLPPEPLWLSADLDRLSQIVANLLSNAAKYTDRGGQIDVTARRDRDTIVLGVRDNGAGISPDLLPRVFDLFTQGAREPGGPREGLGIGLTLVHKIVELHGGSVEARSEGAARGSEFIVRLPALRAGCPREPAAPIEGAPAAGRRLGVLVVEDNEDLAEGMKTLLSLSGHDVMVVHDGPSALEAARAHAPEAVLLDIGLPGMDGYEVARRLRETPGAVKPLLVALSGYGSPRDVERSSEAGFDFHLVKPTQIDEVLRILRSVRPAGA